MAASSFPGSGPKGKEGLEQALRRLGQRLKGRQKVEKSTPVELTPQTTFEALLDERIKNLRQTVDELRGRVNGLIFVVVAAVIVQVLMGFLR
ncbi:MAG: hypothetical protein HYY31_03650 [Chloroflexi bacterium]|nr:hypothetical protein [Chloroflexota bacterium]